MTTAQITPFLFEGEHTIRSIDRAGNPWFVVADVCNTLSITNPTMAVAALDEDEKSTLSLTEGGPDRLIVSESGLYTLILRSRNATKPGTVAHRFRKWVTQEVIPAIRQTGGYGGSEVIPPSPTEHRPFPDWPMEELRTKRGIVDMYRMLYGPMSAQWISPQMGFPPPPIELVEHGRQMKLALITPSANAH